MSASQIVSFYTGGVDHAGRTLDEILGWDRGRLERTHDYIQWLFPLSEQSGANPFAPVLSAADVESLRNDPNLQARMLEALHVMLDLYGLELVEDRARCVRRRPEFDSRVPGWLTPGNHNFLRLTRILRSLRTAGLESHARLVFDALSAIYLEHAATIGDVTYRFWQRAMTDPRLASPEVD